MKIGFIGGAGHHYLKGAIDGTNHIAAVCSDQADEEMSERFAQSFPSAVPRYANADDLIDAFMPDVISVGAVYGLNGPLIERMLRRGLPVVSDKPIAATFTQLARLREIIAINPGSILLTEFDFRSRPSFLAARRAVEDGQIGEPVLTTAQKSYPFGHRPAWYADRVAYGGTLLWILSHSIDVIPFVTRQSITHAVGRQGNLSQPAYKTMEDHVAVLLGLSGGGTALAHADFLRIAVGVPRSDDRLRVAGTAGVIEVREDRCYLLNATHANADITDTAPSRPMHEYLLGALAGDRSLFSTEQSLATAERLLHIRDAADRGTWVDLPAVG